MTLYKRRREYLPVVLAPPPENTALTDPALALWLRSENIPVESKWVTSWPDASGRGRHAKRLVKTRHRLTHDTTTIGNGQRSISWSGRGESRLQIPTFTWPQFGTLVAVYRTSGTDYVASWWDRGSAASQSWQWVDTGGTAGVNVPGTRVTTPHTVSGTPTRVVAVTATSTGWSIQTAGVAGTVAHTTGFPVPAGSRMVLGGSTSDNQVLTSTESYKGALAEVLVYESPLTTARQDQVVRELCTKFGVTYG